MNTTTISRTAANAAVLPVQQNPVRSGRGLAWLKAAITVLGGKVILPDQAPRIWIRTNDVLRTRPVCIIEDNEFSLVATFSDNDEKKMLFSVSTRGTDELTRFLLNYYKPDLKKVEMKYLNIINATFIMAHGALDASDYEKIASAQKLMFALRLGLYARKMPFVGDTLEGAYYDLKYPFNNGIIVQRPPYAPEGDERIHFCAEPYIPFINTSNGNLNVSGGPWFAADKSCFEYLGIDERLFQVFGHEGPCADGAICFPCVTTRWRLTENAGI